MKYKASNPEEYIAQVPADRTGAMLIIRKVIKENLPPGFQEQMSYGMFGYVVPHSIYPSGYHCSPDLPLPFLSFASQKNFIGLYHMGIYANSELMDRFVALYTVNVN